MKIQSFFLFIFIFFSNILLFSLIVSSHEVYLNQWAVQIDGKEELVQAIADRLGYRIVDKVCLILSFWLNCFNWSISILNVYVNLYSCLEKTSISLRNVQWLGAQLILSFSPPPNFQIFLEYVFLIKSSFYSICIITLLFEIVVFEIVDKIIKSLLILIGAKLIEKKTK